MSKPLSKDEIYRVLAGRYKDQDPKIINEISYNLALTSTTEASLNQKAQQALDRIRSGSVNASPLAEQMKSQQKTRGKVCPLCKSQMVLVKLMEDRPAHFCPSHNITEPLPVETGRE